MRFVLPHDEGQRPAWMLRLGLFLYDHLGGRDVLTGSRAIDLRTDEAGAPLQPRLTRGFEYADCAVDDARLVVLNAVDAAERGADIRTRTSVTGARREDGFWRLTLRGASGATEEIAARALAVAAGPWVGSVLRDALGVPTAAPIRLVKGSHLVLRKLFDHDRAYMLQNPDGRIVFAIPYEQDFTLVGTTDVEFAGDLAAPAISEAEITYLLHTLERNFRRAPQRADIVSSFAGIRPLYDDGASAAKDATRDYVLDLEQGLAGDLPRVTVYGGKITTFRRLAEEALDRLAPWFPGASGAWTRAAPLPGGDFPVLSFAGLVADLERRYPFLGHAFARRVARLYGTRAARFLEGAAKREELGRDFGHDLTEAEVGWLKNHEFAMTSDDILWRRTKLGLRVAPAEVRALAEHVGS
jgi:glycerol-3-phosphate dehydrogenase